MPNNFSRDQCWSFIIFLIIISVGFRPIDGNSRCEKLVASRSLEDKQTVVDVDLKHLAGTWISEGCETRPGPEYVLRYYKFEESGEFSLVQHRYWDESCSSPKLTVTANGEIVQKRNSLIQPGASNGYPKILNITVIPQDVRSAKELDRLVETECSGQFWKSWRRYEEHLVFENKSAKRRNWFSGYHSSNLRNILHASGHISCLGSLKYAFNELKLMKIQLKPLISTGKHPKKVRVKEVKMELLLGDIHTNPRLRQMYNPTSFQVPLLKNIEKNSELVIINRHQYSVKNVNTISNLFANKMVPPHLIVKPKLPPYVWGEWTSVRCEIRPMGLYLTRTFYFVSEDYTWIGEHKFFSDPFCNFLKFEVVAAGKFQLFGASKTLESSYDINFQIERASLNVVDTKIIHDMHLNSCGKGEWKNNVPQELSASNGCLQLGIILPSFQKDVVKVEIDSKGSLLLFFGQSETDNMLEIQKERPTSFQSPLVKCGEISPFSLEFHELLSENLDEINGSNNIRSNSKHSFIVTTISMIFLKVFSRF